MGFWEGLEDQREDSADGRQAGNRKGGKVCVPCVVEVSAGRGGFTDRSGRSGVLLCHHSSTQPRGLLPRAFPSRWVRAASYSSSPGASTRRRGTCLKLCREQLSLHSPHSQITIPAPQTHPIGEGKIFFSKEIRPEFNHREQTGGHREEVGGDGWNWGWGLRRALMWWTPADVRKCWITQLYTGN